MVGREEQEAYDFCKTLVCRRRRSKKTSLLRAILVLSLIFSNFKFWKFSKNQNFRNFLSGRLSLGDLWGAGNCMESLRLRFVTTRNRRSWGVRKQSCSKCPQTQENARTLQFWRVDFLGSYQFLFRIVRCQWFFIWFVWHECVHSFSYDGLNDRCFLSPSHSTITKPFSVGQSVERRQVLKGFRAIKFVLKSHSPCPPSRAVYPPRSGIRIRKSLRAESEFVCIAGKCESEG